MIVLLVYLFKVQSATYEELYEFPRVVPVKVKIYNPDAKLRQDLACVENGASLYGK